MKSIVTWFVKNSVPANLLMFFLIVGGIASYQNMKSEFFPKPNINIISINVPYLGASPGEIESSVCSKIEDRLQGIAGIEKVNSYSTVNSALVLVKDDLRYILAQVFLLLRFQKVVSNPHSKVLDHVKHIQNEHHNTKLENLSALR